jgi:hypothetical protein
MVRTLTQRPQPRAHMQAPLPAAAGRLGLGCAQLTAAPAYVAGWIDYLRFIGAHESLFPALPPLLTPTALESSTLPAVEALRDAYETLEGSLERVSDSGAVIPGHLEVQAVLGRQVSGAGTLHLARAKSQTALTHACQAAAERTWRASATRADCTRLTDAGGKESAWVSQCPTRQEYKMTNEQWRDSISIRLAVPLPFLVHGPVLCCCHDRFDRRTGGIAQGAAGFQRGPPGTRRRRRKRPKPVDPFGKHDQSCPHAFTLGRHDEVQNSAIQRKLNEAGKHAKLATVHELRADSTDRSQRKGDLTVSELRADGLPTIADVGIAHPLNDTYLTKQSTEERAFAANKYGSKKDKGYNSTIKKKDLPYGYMSLTFGTFGSFGEGTWRLITKACDPTTHPKAVSDCDPWQLPGPKRDFILTLGFSLQRANSRMIRNADSRRRNARNGRKYASGTRSF